MSEIAKPSTIDLPQFDALDRVLRKRLLAQISRLRDSRVVLDDALGTHEVGEHEPAPGTLRAQLRVHDPAFYRAVAANGSVGRR